MKKSLKLFIFIFIIVLLVSCGKRKQPDNIEDTKLYSITWKDEIGNTINTSSVKENELPTYTYDKKDTQEWDYSFKGWSETLGGTVIEIVKPTTDKTYYAVIDKVKQQYTISFNSNEGSIVDSIKRDYDSSVDAPTNPTKDGYRFICWCTDPELKNALEWPIKLTEDTILYASWNEQVDIPAYLSMLLEDYELNPYSYIPESMRPGYSANLVNTGTVISDYSDFVQVSNIKNNGFGEQWHMVTDNLQQSLVFFNTLSVVEGLITTSVTTFNNYFDKNPADTASHSFASGIYTVTINFNGKQIFYILDYTATYPVLGEQKVQIALCMNIETKEKDVRIQLGDANALAYTISENAYTFAIKYLGVRKAYFTVQRSNDGVEGHIKEFLTISGKGISSAADFYVNDEYLSVVGNKAGGIIGFTGYISELYNIKDGKLLGYEVKETLSKIEYNTLWFDLSSLSGITSIKYQEKTDSTEEAIFVNGLSSAWATKKVGGRSTKTLSRRFDIEFRTQYFYTYDSENKTYVEVSVKVPMLFVQEENYDTLNADVKSVNSTINVNIILNKDNITKLKNDYDSLIEIFIINKENMTEDKIVEIIGDPII